MPKATPIHTPPRPAATTRLAWGSHLSVVPSVKRTGGQDQILSSACRSAETTVRALDLLADGLTSLGSNNPASNAASALVAQMRPGLHTDLQAAARTPSAGSAGLCEKAWLLQVLLEHDESMPCEPAEALGLAASLAADVLRQPWAPEA